nr:MAG TPA: Exonuclease V [Crassvirales sp.]
MLTLRDTRYNDVKLIFKEDGHKYNDTNGNDYISTTTILHSLAPAFDKKYWLKKKAKELGISEKRLEKQWQDITDEACTRGTKTHNGLEDGIKTSSMFKSAVKYMIKDNGEMITIADLPNINLNVKQLDIKEFIDATENKYPQVYDIFHYYTNAGYKIYAEIGAFLMDFLISGTIDVLCIRDDKFVIGDWKTNRGGLKFEAGYYKKDKTQKPNQLTNDWVAKKEFLLPPVNHLPNCNGSIYNLQLSMYAFMVESILGIPNAGLWLCHIDSDFVLNEYGMPKRFPDGLYHVKKNPVEKTTVYKMKYLKEEIIRILADRRKVVNANKTLQQTLF